MTAYENITVQWLVGDWKINKLDPGSNGQIEFDNEPIQPAAVGDGDGLERGECAELLAIETQMTLQEYFDSGLTDTVDLGPGSLMCRHEVSTMPNLQTSSLPTIQLADGSFGDEPGDSFSTDHYSQQDLQVSDGSEVFDFTTMAWQLGWNDSENGTGGGYTTDHHRHIRNFNQMFGGGPVVNHEDNLYVNGAISVRNSGEQHRIRWAHKLYWDLCDT